MVASGSDSDSSGAIRVHTMHIERRHLKVRELVASGIIKVHKVHTDDNLADFFTKSLNPRRFARLRDQLMRG